MSIRSPVLLLVFNRPDTTGRVFDAIRAARPPRLYVAADGPRVGRVDEAERCESTRRIATAVDWPCELITLMREKNLGCKLAVSSAITWFFEQESEGIVLEDDCLPDPSFFPYCDDLLERHRDDRRVMCISGDNFISDTWRPEDSYWFSVFVHIWGWASWRRAWQLYDADMRDWSTGDQRKLLERQLPDDPHARAHWHALFDQVANGRIDTWDYQWTYACWKHAGFSCVPGVNLISNIGFGAGATHTTSLESSFAALPVASLRMPLRHPELVQADAGADRRTSQRILDVLGRRGDASRWRRVLKRLRRLWPAIRA